MTFRNDNKFVPKYFSNDLKWYERHSLDTWYLQNKCNDFLNDTDKQFKQAKIINFDMIENNESKQKRKQYQTLDHHEIMHYPLQLRVQICFSLFRNRNRKDMHIKKETIKEHLANKEVGTGWTFY